jgi:hypothetical protein
MTMVPARCEEWGIHFSTVAESLSTSAIATVNYNALFALLLRLAVSCLMSHVSCVAVLVLPVANCI